MTSAPVTNSTPARKQLSDQLDRLDGILDALSEGLNGAVADAAREGTRLAVRDAIVEIMTDPTLRARLHEASAPPPATEPAPSVPKPRWWVRLQAQVGRSVASVSRAAHGLVDGAGRGLQAVARTAAGAVRTVQSLGHLKNVALVGLGVGVAVGVASFLAPHAVAAAVSGLGSAVAAVAVQVGVWARRAYRALALA
jgi:hypothetical protein